MSNTNFLFAWSQYVDDNSKLGFKPVYFGVRADLTIFTCENWEEFYSVARCYCEHAKQLFCDGFLIGSEGLELFEHKSYNRPFYIVENKLIPVYDDQIEFYPYEADNEAAYFRNHNAYVG